MKHAFDFFAVTQNFPRSTPSFSLEFRFHLSMENPLQHRKIKLIYNNMEATNIRDWSQRLRRRPFRNIRRVGTRSMATRLYSCERLNGLFNAHSRRNRRRRRPFYTRDTARQTLCRYWTLARVSVRSIDSRDIVRSRIGDSTVAALSIAATVSSFSKKPWPSLVVLRQRSFLLDPSSVVRSHSAIVRYVLASWR